MATVQFEAINGGEQIQLQILDSEGGPLTPDYLRNQFKLTEFRDCFLLEEALLSAVNLSKAPQADAVEIIVAEQRPAQIQVKISGDKMECELIVESAYGAKNPDTDWLSSELANAGVSFGIDSNKLKAIANQLTNIAPGTMIKESVAKGKPVGQSKQARIELLIQPLQDRLMKPQLRENGTVDMHDFGDIEMVEPGDQLAKRIPPAVGMPGKNVLGEPVHAPKPEDRLLEIGEGTQLSPADKNVLVAARKGVPLKIPGGVEVSEAYCVKDVDLTTGNIDFDGTVIVQGSVRQGMSVKATKKVMVRDYVESAEVSAGADLIIGKGVLGQKIDQAAESFSANIHCGGDFFAAYVQYAKVEAAQQCTVTKHILHSQIQANAIEMDSPKKNEAKIIGGVMQPQTTLTCNSLGAPSYIGTKVDFSTRFAGQLQELKGLNKELGERINVVRGMNTALAQIENKTSCSDASEQVTKISNTIEHFQSVISELKEKRKCLIQEMEAIKEQFEVVVKRNLYPGVEIQFIQKLLPIKQEKNSCKIKAKDDGLVFFTV